MQTVYHFFLDHRSGGPHEYVATLELGLSGNYKFSCVSAGYGFSSDFRLFNFRRVSRVLFPIEVCVNIVKLVFIFFRMKGRQGCVFDVHGAANIAPVVAARLLRIPFIWHLHETIPTYRFLFKAGCFGASNQGYRVVAVAKKCREVFDTPAVVIPCGVDTEFWSPHAKSEVSLTRRPLRLVAVGNLNPLKGHDLLLQGLSCVNGPWVLDIIGAELSSHIDYLRLLKLEISKLGGRGIVQLLGWRSRQDVRSLLRAADVFVLSSRSEACPIALLEAMSTGCACIATNVGDISDIIGVNRQFGLLIKPGDPSAISDAINLIQNTNEFELSAMRVRARNRIISDYSMSKLALAHRDLYSDLFQGCYRRLK